MNTIKRRYAQTISDREGFARWRNGGGALREVSVAALQLSSKSEKRAAEVGTELSHSDRQVPSQSGLISFSINAADKVAGTSAVSKG